MTARERTQARLARIRRDLIEAATIPTPASRGTRRTIFQMSDGTRWVVSPDEIPSLVKLTVDDGADLVATPDEVVELHARTHAGEAVPELRPGPQRWTKAARDHARERTVPSRHE